MDLIGNIVVDGICLAVLFVLFFAKLKSSRRGMFSTRLYQWILLTAIFLLVADMLGRLDGASTFSVPIANTIGNFLLFTFNSLIPILWLIYILYQVERNTILIKKIALPLVLYFAINVALVGLNVAYGFYYTIDNNNVYARGDYYGLAVIFALIPFAVAMLVVLIKHCQIDSGKLVAFIFFPLAPVIGTALTFFTYGYSIVLPSLMIAALLVFISLQIETLNLDYLTGVYNRRYLEDHLRKKIDDNNPQFAGIMLDINSFKQINDTFGHSLGDRALIDFARVLQNSVGINDIVARYGGDEFMIIVSLKNPQNLPAVVDNIKNNIEKFNARFIYPFALSASFGQAVYRPDTHPTLEQFINNVDDLMYVAKNEYRHRSSAIK